MTTTGRELIPADMIARWQERHDDREVARASRAARNWTSQLPEFRDAELMGLFVAAEREMQKRGLLAKPDGSHAE